MGIRTRLACSNTIHSTKYVFLIVVLINNSSIIPPSPFRRETNFHYYLDNPFECISPTRLNITVLPHKTDVSPQAIHCHGHMYFACILTSWVVPSLRKYRIGIRLPLIQRHDVVPQRPPLFTSFYLFSI